MNIDIWSIKQNIFITFYQFYFRSRSDTSLSNHVGYDYYSGDYDYYGGEYLPPTEFEAKMTKFVRYVAKGKASEILLWIRPQSLIRYYTNQESLINVFRLISKVFTALWQEFGKRLRNDKMQQLAKEISHLIQ